MRASLYKRKNNFFTKFWQNPENKDFENIKAIQLQTENDLPNKIGNETKTLVEAKRQFYDERDPEELVRVIKYNSDNFNEILGFMPLREDFDVEYDNEAELLLAEMEFDGRNSFKQRRGTNRKRKGT